MRQAGSFNAEDGDIRIEIEGHSPAFEAEPGQTLAEVLDRQGVALTIGCRSGTCGLCRVELLSGSVERLPHGGTALRPEEIDAGHLLACRTRVSGDCRLRLVEEPSPPRPVTESRHARLVSLEPATHDIRILHVEMLEESLAFAAGQYVQVTFPGFPARDYSLANRPDGRMLEFHVRLVGEGASTQALRSAVPGMRLQIAGPYGRSYLRTLHRGPIVAVAGGSGLAPMKSIVEEALYRGARQPIRLYFGVRAERDLYHLDHFAVLEERHPNFRFVPVLSEPTSTTAYRHGMVTDVVGEDIADFDGVKVYMAGPPAMAEAGIAMFTARGLDPVNLHADPFYGADDPRAREARG